MKHPDLAPTMFLLVHDPATGRHTASRETVCAALVGAVLGDLTIAGTLVVVDGRVSVTGRKVPPRPAEPVVRFMVEAISREPESRPVGAWARAVGEAVYGLVARGLVEAGVVRREESRRLRGGPADRYPVLDPIRAARPRLEIEHMIDVPRAFDLPGAVVVAVCRALGVGGLPDGGEVVGELPPVLRALVTGVAGPIPTALPRDERMAGTRLRVESGAMTRRAAHSGAGPSHAALRARHDEIVGRDLDDRVPALEQMVADCTHDLGPWHPDTLIAEGNLAVAYLVAGRADVGIPLLVTTLAARERVLGDDHPATLSARDVLASVHRTAGRPAQALLLYEAVVARRTRALGPRHPDTLTSRLGLGLSRADAGELRAALAVLEPARTDARDSCGPGHRLTIALRGALAECLLACGQPVQGRVELELAARDASRVLGIDDPDTLALRAAIAEL